MPVLKHPRRELFAQELAKGKTQVEAYKIAGYKPNDGNAGLLARRPEIIARTTEINRRGAARAEITVESICRELDEARKLALKLEQPSPMVMASLGKAKVARLTDDVTRHFGPDGGPIRHSIEIRFVDAPESDE